MGPFFLLGHAKSILVFVADSGDHRQVYICILRGAGARILHRNRKQAERAIPLARGRSTLKPRPHAGAT